MECVIATETTSTTKEPCMTKESENLIEHEFGDSKEMYNLVCKREFEKTEKAFEKTEEGFKDAKTERKEITDEVVLLRETVNNGLTHRVKTIYTLFFWFFGIYLTVTGITFAAGFSMIRLIMAIQQAGG